LTSKYYYEGAARENQYHVICPRRFQEKKREERKGKRRRTGQLLTGNVGTTQVFGDPTVLPSCSRHLTKKK